MHSIIRAKPKPTKTVLRIIRNKGTINLLWMRLLWQQYQTASSSTDTPAKRVSSGQTAALHHVHYRSMVGSGSLSVYNASLGFNNLPNSMSFKLNVPVDGVT